MASRPNGGGRSWPPQATRCPSPTSCPSPQPTTPTHSLPSTGTPPISWRSNHPFIGPQFWWNLGTGTQEIKFQVRARNRHGWSPFSPPHTFFTTSGGFEFFYNYYSFEWGLQLPTEKLKALGFNWSVSTRSFSSPCNTCWKNRGLLLQNELDWPLWAMDPFHFHFLNMKGVDCSHFHFLKYFSSSALRVTGCACRTGTTNYNLETLNINMMHWGIMASSTKQTVTDIFLTGSPATGALWEDGSPISPKLFPSPSSSSSLSSSSSPLSSMASPILGFIVPSLISTLISNTPALCLLIPYRWYRLSSVIYFYTFSWINHQKKFSPDRMHLWAEVNIFLFGIFKNRV